MLSSWGLNMHKGSDCLKTTPELLQWKTSNNCPISSQIFAHFSSSLVSTNFWENSNGALAAKCSTVLTSLMLMGSVPLVYQSIFAV